jgi:GNAT superfamily N-acetyltransferase
MNHGYILHDDDGHPMRCTANLLFMHGKSAVLSGVEVAYSLRGMGYGTRLLKLVLDDADKEGYVLLLSVGTDDSPKALSNEQLEAWYERHGFYRIEGKTGNGVTMQRLPKEWQ